MILNITIQSGYKFLVLVHIVIAVMKNCSCDTKTKELYPGNTASKIPFFFACVGKLSDNTCITNKGDTTLLSRV